MEINGPIRIGVIDREDAGGRELHFTFTEDFQKQDLQSQTNAFATYLQELQQAIFEYPESDPNRQGMLLVQQVCEQMFPYIAEGEIALAETIVVALTPEQQASSEFKVIDLLNN